MTLSLDELLEIRSLSYSNKVRYDKCPFNWLCNKFGMPEEKVDKSASDFGVASHSSIATYFNLIGYDSREVDVELIKNCFLLEDIFAKMPEKTRTVVENFIAFEKGRLKACLMYKPFLIEYKFEVKVWRDLPELHGVVDFYGDETIIDWKTGKLNGDLALQDATYRLALREMGFTVRKVVFAGLGVNSFVSLEEANEGEVHNQYKRFADLVGERWFPKIFSPLCNWCEYPTICRKANGLEDLYELYLRCEE